MGARNSGDKKRTSTVKRWLRRVFVYGVVVLVLSSTGLWLKDIIQATQVIVVTAQKGSLEAPVDIEAWVINSEQVVTSPYGGQIDKVIPEGERVRKGSLVARVISQGINGQGKGVKGDLYSPNSGLVSYRVDGLEGLFTPKNVQDWELDKFLTSDSGQTPGDSVQSGQGVYKVLDNLLPTYLLFKLPKSGITLKQGDKLTLVLGEQRINGKVVKWATQGPQEGVLVSTNSFLQASLGKRKIGLAWVEKTEAGLIIPAEAVINRQGEKGIFVVREGIVKWQAVKLLAQYNAQACVEEQKDGKALKAGDSVVANPSYVKEGQVIKK